MIHGQPRALPLALVEAAHPQKGVADQGNPDRHFGPKALGLR